MTEFSSFQIYQAKYFHSKSRYMVNNINNQSMKVNFSQSLEDELDLPLLAVELLGPGLELPPLSVLSQVGHLPGLGLRPRLLQLPLQALDARSLLRQLALVVGLHAGDCRPQPGQARVRGRQQVAEESLEVELELAQGLELDV
jgi:hypothetical protein